MSDGCIDFTNLSAGIQENDKDSAVMEEIAMEDENAMESFWRPEGLPVNKSGNDRAAKDISVLFGSALRNAGVDTFYRGLTDIHWHRNTRMNLA